MIDYEIPNAELFSRADNINWCWWQWAAEKYGELHVRAGRELSDRVEEVNRRNKEILP